MGGDFLRHSAKTVVFALTGIGLLCFLVSGAWLLRYYAQTRAYEEIREELRLMPDGPVQSRLDFLREQYPGVAALLSIPALEMEEPVCAAQDNDYYMSRDFTGRKSRYGALFLDCEQDFESRNMSVYGHYSKKGAMFGKLKAFRDGAFLARHPEFTLETAAGTQRWHIFAVLLLPAKGEGFWEWRAQGDAAPARVEAFAREARARALCETGEPVYPGDRLLSLTTCAYDFPNARLVILAVNHTNNVHEGEYS